MRILIACEFSGKVREAFRAYGHEAWSCDLLQTERPGPHIQADVLNVLHDSWDMIVAFPPCTHLASSGARWFSQKRKNGQQQAAIELFMAIANAPCPRIAIENPIGIMSTQWRKPDQIVQPWQFGHGETKGICLWLRGLPHLHPTMVVEGRQPRIHRMGESQARWRNRSITYDGIAQAMADQWGFFNTHPEQGGYCE